MAVWLLMLLPFSALADALLDGAERLIEQGQPEAAYEQLQSAELERAGDPAFDYWLGVAAADAGHHMRALFALDRLLTQRPNHLQGRAERARVYLLLGDYATARQEFERVLAAGPPPTVVTTVQDYLARIETELAALRGQWSGSFALLAGYDSNVNSGTEQSTASVAPALGLPGNLLTIDTQAQGQADRFAGLSGRLGYSRSQGHGRSWQGQVALATRRHPEQDAFDTTTLDLSLGVARPLGGGAVSLALFGQAFRLAGEDNRRLYGLGAEWQRERGVLARYGVFVQGLRLDYPTQSQRDAEQLNLGLSNLQQFVAKGMPQLATTLWFGHERNRADQEALGRDSVGLRLQLGYRVAEIPLRGMMLFQRVRYAAEDLITQSRREEILLDLSLSGDYRLAPRWVLTPFLRHTRNNANDDLYDYRRSQVSLALGYTF